MDIEIMKNIHLTPDEVFEAVLQYLESGGYIELDERDRANYGFFGEMDFDDNDTLLSVHIPNKSKDGE